MKKGIREVEKERCPRCGSVLITDGIHKWCTFIGSQRENIPGCEYGLDSNVSLFQESL